MRYKILSDSSSDITNAFYQGETAFDYAVVPMSINGPGGISLADIDPVDSSKSPGISRANGVLPARLPPPTSKSSRGRTAISSWRSPPA